METFGQRFQRLRKAKGLTQEDIANKINISAQAVSKWENDLTSPDISVLGELSDIFGVSIDELLGKEIPKNAEILPPEQRGDVGKLLLKITVDSEGDKIRVNLPIALVKIFIDSDTELPSVNGKDTLKNIDWKQVVSLVEQGVIGEIVSLETAEGDIIKITVE